MGARGGARDVRPQCVVEMQGLPHVLFGDVVVLLRSHQGYAGQGTRLRRQADGPKWQKVRRATAQPVVVLVCLLLSTLDVPRFDQF